jgi:hypothetical protein
MINITHTSNRRGLQSPGQPAQSGQAQGGQQTQPTPVPQPIGSPIQFHAGGLIPAAHRPKMSTRWKAVFTCIGLDLTILDDQACEVVLEGDMLDIPTVKVVFEDDLANKVWMALDACSLAPCEIDIEVLLLDDMNQAVFQYTYARCQLVAALHSTLHLAAPSTTLKLVAQFSYEEMTRGPI